MKIRLFHKLQIFGLTIPVYKIPSLADEGILGYYDTDEKQIGLDSGLKGQEQTITVLHEMFHAVLDRLHCQQQMPIEFAEVIVENLARSVVDNFKLTLRK